MEAASLGFERQGKPLCKKRLKRSSFAELSLLTAQDQDRAESRFLASKICFLATKCADISHWRRSALPDFLC